MGNGGFIHRIRRAFSEFLAIPTLIVIGFTLLAVLMVSIEAVDVPLLSAAGDAMQRFVFSDGSATSSLLSETAGSVTTLTSITFSVLLLAVQQAGSTLTHAVFDQFLRRSTNQVFFGFFVGTAVYLFIALAATGDNFNPVLAASLGLLLTIVAFMLLIVLIYSTVNQMRPPIIVEAVRTNTIQAWKRQRRTIRHLRAEPRLQGPEHELTSDVNGYVVGIDFEGIGRALRERQAELVVTSRIGAYVAKGGVLGKLRHPADSADKLDELKRKIRAAFSLDSTRDVQNDAAYGVEELANIGWTSISTSKQNPIPGRNVILALRDVLGRFADGEANEAERGDDELPIVYERSFTGDALDALEQMGIACSESLQGQNFAEVLRTISLVFSRFSPGARERALGLVNRLLSAMGELVLTADLSTALDELSATVHAADLETAHAVQRAHERLAQSVGELNARSTRVKAGA